MIFRSLLAVAMILAIGSVEQAKSAEYKWTDAGFVMVNATAADETAITEHELLASTPRRSVTRTTTTTRASTPVLMMSSSCNTATTTATSCNSVSSSRTTTVVRQRQRQFAPVRRLFGFRLRSGC